MRSRKLFAILLGMMVAVPSIATMAQSQLKVTIDNASVVFSDAKPFVDENNRTLVPLRFISEELGAKVEWNKSEETVTVMKDTNKVVLTVGKATMTVNGQTKSMDTTPIMKEGRIFVPVKYIGEVLNVKVNWIAKESTVAITKGITGDAVVAKVNDLTITAGEVLNQLEYEMMLIQYQNQLDDTFLETDEAKQYMKERKPELVDYIIKNKIALIKGKELKLEPTSEQVNSEFNATKASYTSTAEFDKALADSGLTVETYKTQIKASLTIANVAEYIMGKITVTDAEIKTYYQNNNAAYTKGAGAQMSHILVATQEEAKTIKAAYDKGTSFEELAKKYGTDGTKDNGGALGYIEYSDTNYDSDFLNGAKTLKEGEVSNPVQTQFGWHLIKVTNVHKEAYQIPLEKVKEEIKTAITSEKSSAFIYSQLDEWSKTMTVEKYEDIINKL